MSHRASSEDDRHRLVRFRDGDDVVEYNQAEGSNSGVLPRIPLSSPSLSSTTTTSSETLQTPSPSRGLPLAPSKGDSLVDNLVSPRMSDALIASFAQPWNIFETEGDRSWDKFDATANNAGEVTLYIEGLPSPISVGRSHNGKPILVGDIYRVIIDYLTTDIPYDGEEFRRLDDKAKSKVLQKFLLRKVKNPDSKLQRRDFLLEHQVLRRIVPFGGGEAWRVQFISH